MNLNWTEIACIVTIVNCLPTLNKGKLDNSEILSSILADLKVIQHYFLNECYNLKDVQGP